MNISGDSTLQKLILLFVFDKMEVPLSEETIVDMCSVTNNWIPQMECRPVLMQLLDTAFIYRISASHEALYAITAEGRVCLAHFFVRIPASLRESISDFVRQNRMKYRRRQDYQTDYFKNADGTYTVVLKILEPAQSVLEIKMNMPSRQTAKQVNKQWEEKAPQIFVTLYDLLVD